MKSTLQELMDTLPQIGTVEWIGVRPARKQTMLSQQTVEATIDQALAGDRYSSAGGNRQVTLIQAEHLAVLASILACEPIEPEQLRRNIVVRGINLLALKKRSIRVGSTCLQVTGLCHPCSRMESILGPGGYNAMRGHGGITARIVTAGQICVGDSVCVSTAPAYKSWCVSTAPAYKSCDS